MDTKANPKYTRTPLAEQPREKRFSRGLIDGDKTRREIEQEFIALKQRKAREEQ